MKKRKVKRERGMKLNAFKFGIAGGVVTGLCFFLVTIAGLIWSGYASHSTWILQEIYGFLGYGLNMAGAFLGAVYGFVSGFVLFWFFAVVYGWLIRER